MLGVANANLTALGTSYSNTNLMYLVDKENIQSPWDQYAKGWIQNFTAAGLLAYASNTKLIYPKRQDIYNDLNKKFGDGTGNPASTQG
jgi:hypothetical protein